jgi:hypothetical protein
MKPGSSASYAPMWWGITTVLAFTMAVTINFLWERGDSRQEPQIAMDRK